MSESVLRIWNAAGMVCMIRVDKNIERNMIQWLVCFPFIFKGGLLLNKIVQFSSYYKDIADYRFSLKPEFVQAAC